jgi:hypothetical protein
MSIDAGVLLVHLRTVGAILTVLVALNLVVPWRLRWREEMARLSLLNRQIFQAHSIVLVLILAMMAALLLTSADALIVPGPLSRAILIGFTLFWGLRMLMQWWFYSPATWRGNTLHTVLHVVFSVTWIYMTGVFGMALWQVS